MLEVQPDFVGQEHAGFVCAFVFLGGLVVFYFFKGTFCSEELEAEKCKLADFSEVVC